MGPDMIEYATEGGDRGSVDGSGLKDRALIAQMQWGVRLYALSHGVAKDFVPIPNAEIYGANHKFNGSFHVINCLTPL